MLIIKVTADFNGQIDITCPDKDPVRVFLKK
jgi:hypothetical protein